MNPHEIWSRYVDGEFSDPAKLELHLEPVTIQILFEFRQSTDKETSDVAHEKIRGLINSPRRLSPGQEETKIDQMLATLLDEREPWFDRVSKGFLRRRERDMTDQRFVPFDDFLEVYRGPAHFGVLWGAFVEKHLVSSFRIDEDGGLRNVEDEIFEPPDGTQIAVIHPFELDHRTRAQWETIFAEFELMGFPQLDRPVKETYSIERNSVVIDGLAAHAVLGEYRWHGEDWGYFVGLDRMFKRSKEPTMGHLRISQSRILLSFSHPSKGAIDLEDVHPIVVHEAIRAIEQAIDTNAIDNGGV